MNLWELMTERKLLTAEIDAFVADLYSFIDQMGNDIWNVQQSVYHLPERDVRKMP